MKILLVTLGDFCLGAVDKLVHRIRTPGIFNGGTLLLFACAPVAQWIEHGFNEAGDTGSSPVRGTSPERLHSINAGGAFLHVF